MNVRRSASGSVFTQVLCALSFSTVAACSAASSPSSTTTASEESEALSASTASEASFQAQASGCAAAFQTCVSVANADIASCKATLEKCLPNDPPPGPGCGTWDDGGVPTPPVATDAAAPTAPPAPQPPTTGTPPTQGGGDDDGGGAGGGQGHGGGHSGSPTSGSPGQGGASADAGCDKGQGQGQGAGGGHSDPLPPFCGHVPLPKSPALEACRTTLESCMQAATDDTERKACIDSAHACVKAAFEAARAAGQ